MRRVLLIIFLSFAGLVLLAAVGLGILLATFNPNAYSQKISAAVEKSTGRQLRFQGEITTAFFPTPSLKTGRLVMDDPGIFGGDSFLTVESASVSLAVQPLLQGIIQIEEIHLQGPVLHLLTTASGRHNWEYGIGSGLPESGPGTQQTDGAVPLADVRQPDPDGDSGDGKVIPLTDPLRSGAPETGFFSRLVVQVERFTCTDARVLYRDQRTGASCTGSLDDFSLNSARRDADIPLAASGTLADNASARKVQFSFKGSARLDSSGALALRAAPLDMTIAGLTAEPLALKNQGELRYDPAARRLDLRGLKGGFDKTGYGGNLIVVLPEKSAPVTITGDLTIDNLDLDALTGRLMPGVSPPDAEEVKGAPNLTRPKIASSGKPFNRDLSGSASGGTTRNQESASADAGKGPGAVPVLAGVDGNVVVTATALTLNKLPVDKLSFTLRSENDVLSVPFFLEVFGGAATGSARLDFNKGLPSVDFSAAVKSLDMEKLSLAMAAKTTVIGALSADVEVSGRGGSWKELAPTLKGKTSAQILKGEVKDFALIPSNLRGVKDVPVDFPFERISGSGKIERGIITSKDIALQSKLVAGTGGGTINLVFEQLDLGMDFMIAGQPPAIPVNITGPFTSLSSSVDVRTLMRNTAEGALTSPENARELLRDAERLLTR